MARCPGTRFLMGDAPREASPFGERYWLEYRLLLQELEYGHPRRYSLDGCNDDRSVDVAVTAAEAVPEPPGCFGEGWRVDVLGHASRSQRSSVYRTHGVGVELGRDF